MLDRGHLPGSDIVWDERGVLADPSDGDPIMDHDVWLEVFRIVLGRFHLMPTGHILRLFDHFERLVQARIGHLRLLEMGLGDHGGR